MNGCGQEKFAMNTMVKLPGENYSGIPSYTKLRGNLLPGKFLWGYGNNLVVWGILVIL